MQLGDEVEDVTGRRGLLLAYAGARVAWVWMYAERRGRWCPTYNLDITEECRFEKAREEL